CAMTKYVFFQAHPDDLEINCPHLLYHLGRRGHEIRIASVTKGEFGLPGPEYDHLKGDFLVRIRENELADACAIYGIPRENIDYLGYIDGFVTLDRVFVDHIAKYLKKHRPDVVVAPEGLYAWYYHMDHLNTGRAVFYVINKGLLKHTPRLYFYDSLCPNTYFPIPNEDIDVADRAIDCHKTQWWIMSWMRHLVRPTRLLGGLHVNGWKYAEPYRYIFFDEHLDRMHRPGPLIQGFVHFMSGIPFFQAKYPQAILEERKKKVS
ncbi:MAG: PIG-L deacetylase family protein, partial [Candidatus Thorarchaeota archaeon SMTZ1-45]